MLIFTFFDFSIAPRDFFLLRKRRALSHLPLLHPLNLTDASPITFVTLLVALVLLPCPDLDDDATPAAQHHVLESSRRIRQLRIDALEGVVLVVLAPPLPDDGHLHVTLLAVSSELQRNQTVGHFRGRRTVLVDVGHPPFHLQLVLVGAAVGVGQGGLSPERAAQFGNPAEKTRQI